jgi:putative oxidoreductase
LDVVFLIGRILFVAIFLGSGIKHFTARQQMIPFARASGAPAPEVMIPLTGAMIFVGGLSVLLGIWADVGALLIFAFLVPAAFLMHAFWKEEDAQTKQAQQAQFMKNIALAGAALIVFYLYNQAQGGAALSITDPLFGRG